MFIFLKKVLIASIVALALLMSGGWQSNYVVMAESHSTNVPKIPLYTGLTWNNIGMIAQEIRINANGNTVSLVGERYEAKEKFIAGLPKDVLNYYSNTQLAKSGWVSYDAFEKSDGTHYVFSHEDGVYLSIEFLKCPDAPLSTCISVWKSEQSKNVIVSSAEVPGQKQSAATGSFGKKSPANGTTNLDPKSVILSWNAYTPEPDNYSYCVKEGSACSADDPEWTNTWGKTSVTLTNLSYDKTYYWQVKARVCASCVPQTLVYADNGTVWTFKTHPPTHGIIVGNAGVPGAVLSYVDITPKTITADNYGSYLITIPLGWSGMITPDKPGYLFSPKNANFTNLTALQTIQNFSAVPSHLISGNVSVPGAKLNYTYDTPQNVIPNNNGDYSIVLPDGWSGTVTPTHPCYTFSPSSRVYSNVTGNYPGEDYIASEMAGKVCVLAIQRADPNPTSAGTVTFTVTFMDAVTGVDPSDFVLTTVGVSGASITDISGTGDTYTVMVVTGTGNGTIRLDVVDDDSIVDGDSNPLGGTGTGNGDYNSGEVYDVEKYTILQTNFSSVGTYDGWILESGEASNNGGTMNASNSIFYLGDDAQNKQYRAILHFDTSSLPDNAVIVDAKLRLSTNEVVSGTNPFLTHDKIVIELNTGAYSTSSNLQLDDFKLPSDRNGAGAVQNNLVNGLYRGRIKGESLEYFNLSGATQIRLRFKTDDDNDNVADLIEFFSGNASASADRPRLVIYYYVP